MRVLLLEDDPFLQIDIAHMVKQLGHEVIGPYSRVAEALVDCKASKPEVAIIDFNLGEAGDSSELADYFDRNDIPFAFSTGYSTRHLPTKFAHIPVIEKPFREVDIRDVLLTLAGPGHE